MEIIQLGIDDMKNVFELSNQLEYASLSFDAFKPCFYEIISLKNHVIYGAKVDKVIGYIHLRSEKQLHHASIVVEVLELIIDESYRSQKIGKKLLDFAISYAKSIGATHIELTTNVIRERAHLFYLREGFKQTSLKFVKELKN